MRKKVVYVFIDASNLWEAQKIKGRFFNYEKLKKFLAEKYEAEKLEFFYYTAYPAEDTRDYDLDGRHKFYTFLSKGLGFNVRKKELKRITVLAEEGQTVKEKGDLDVELTIDALHHIDKYDTVVLFSGDSDFLALVSYLRKRDKGVYIFSSKNNVSEELRTGGDGYEDVLEIEEDIWGKELKHRSEKTKK